ncbi:hypothetical protein L249_1121 [Ophiocordyceps polyrhachis-furcata BCC 54312]|uniref:Uncharacterized protein n=1 Tax=Ophiocordyceps polyrhachis-furcata BCC 54312 TaxID=1330021 RepID=A0A367LD93_9HYPO|nr:hypothetical protein L249_1121 [Ophiocordyceps polyrhachis-furcata BCC 54312]
MNKCTSVLVGFAAIGAFAQLDSGSKVPETPGFGDACHQNGYPDGYPAKYYPCNEVVEYTAACNGINDLVKHRNCICEPYLRAVEEGCLKCKQAHGLHSKNEDKYWKEMLESTLAAYCKMGNPTVTYPVHWQGRRTKKGDPPLPGAEGDDERINSLGGDVSPERYMTEFPAKPDMSKYGPVPTGTVPVEPSRVLVVATQTASADGVTASASVSIPKYPTNGTSSSFEASVDAKVSLHVVGFDVKANVTNEGVKWQSSSPYYVPNAKVEAASIVKISAKARVNIVDGSFCGCIPKTVACGQSVVVDGKVKAKACYTALKPSADGKELVVDEKRTSDKPLPGAGPISISASASVGVVPYYPAPAICRPECNKAEAHVSVSPAGVHAKASVCVVVAAQGDSKVYVPAAYVKNDAVVPPGAPAPLPNTVPEAPAGSSKSHKTAPGSGPAAPAKDSRPDSSNPSPADGSSPASGAESADSPARPASGGAKSADSPARPASGGAKPADSPVRPVGTGLPIPPASVPQKPEAEVFKGAAAMNLPSMALAAGLLVAAF